MAKYTVGLGGSFDHLHAGHDPRGGSWNPRGGSRLYFYDSSRNVVRQLPAEMDGDFYTFDRHR